MEDQYLKAEKWARLSLLIGSLTILSLLLLLLSFGFNFQQAASAQGQQQMPSRLYQQQQPSLYQQQGTINTPQWQSYKSPNSGISIRYPAGWNVVELSTGFQLFSPDNSYRIGLENCSPGLCNPAGASLQNIGQRAIQGMSQRDFSIISSQILTSPDGPKVMNFYRDNLDNRNNLVEFLIKKDNGFVYRYHIFGPPSQIQKYYSLATKIFQTVQFDPSWELQMINQNHAGSINTLGTLAPATNALPQTSAPHIPDSKSGYPQPSGGNSEYLKSAEVNHKKNTRLLNEQQANYEANKALNAERNNDHAAAKSYQSQSDNHRSQANKK